MQLDRKWTVPVSGLAFVTLFWGGYGFFSRPGEFVRTVPGATLFFTWGIALSALLHSFWIALISKQNLQDMGRILLRLHGFYILPCVMTLFFTYAFILRYRLKLPFPMLEILIFGIGGVFVALTLYDLKKGNLATSLNHAHSALKYSLILPAILAVWFLCLQVMGVFFVF